MSLTGLSKRIDQTCAPVRVSINCAVTRSSLSACWTLPQVNAYPLFIEPIPRTERGVLASDLRSGSRTLEDVFLDLTGRALRD